MNLTTFFMAYIVAFVLLWRMALVGLPFVLLLIIPGLIYSRILMVLVRKIMHEYDKAGNIVEQAISSIRTVCSFVGESKTMNGFSVALEGYLKYGLKQGLVKGVAIGSNGITFAVWALMAWYASRLVMYYDVKGGTVFCGWDSNESWWHSLRIRSFERESVSGDAEFKNVKFAYPSRPENTILEAFCLKLPASKTVALMGIVSQEPCLFATSIKENILFGKEDATMDEVIDAAKASNAHNFISQLLQGYDTQVDEATSALDLESEIVVQKALEKAAVGRTTIKNSHRLSTVHDADVIAVKTENEECNMPGSSSHITNRDSIGSSRRLSLVRQTSSANSVSEVQVVQIPSFRRLLLLNLPEWKLGCSSAVLRYRAAGVHVYNGEHDISLYFGAMGEHLTKRIRERMLAKIMTFEVGWFDPDENSSGAIFSRLTKDASPVRSLVGDRISLLAQVFSATLVAWTMGLIIKFALVMIAEQPLIVICFYLRRILLKRMSSKAIKCQNQCSKVASEAVSNH
ncbi:hypothetical protein GIB67_020701 [Kingdonia uniflora]|uniref:ABC transmembrane type-1 domain-containing protein n=1 Tax=Kingdonia uniflora TaxID=39325 RepID=A0A7J7NJM5_9MAGN|nr:hypothetical protein GIB67_020701 [Kingdonia uniflora]